MTLFIGAILILTGSAAPAEPAQQRFASSVVGVYADDTVDGRHIAADPGRLPSNITIPAVYRREIEAMLRSSPTFRSQCGRIGRAADLQVVIQQSVLPPAQSAVTHVTRRPDGHLDAEVEVGPLGDAVMLIAHEFEHIIEQLDGVDLPALADRSGTGVRADPKSGNFETERAIAIGRRVVREVSTAVARR